MKKKNSSELNRNFTCTFYFSCHTDIDECNQATHNCLSKEDCSNTVGSFTCSKCKAGFEINEGRCKGILRTSAI